MPRIQIIGLTEVPCAEDDVPGAAHEGCTTTLITLRDNLTDQEHQVTWEEIHASTGGHGNDNLLEYLNHHLRASASEPEITINDIWPDPRRYDLRLPFLPLERNSQSRS